MSYFNPANSAEAGDRLAVLTGFATGLAALIHSVNIWETMVGADVAAALQTLQLGGGIVILVVFLPLFIWFKRTRFAPAMNPWKGESFLSDAVRRAGASAFAIILLTGFVLSTLKRVFLSKITAEIMLDLTITTALAVFSLSFFLYAFGPDGDGVE